MPNWTVDELAQWIRLLTLRSKSGYESHRQRDLKQSERYLDEYILKISQINGDRNERMKHLESYMILYHDWTMAKKELKS
jgi:hypothetical protein